MKKIECSKCKREYSAANIKKHFSSCHPTNCLQCNVLYSVTTKVIIASECYKNKFCSRKCKQEYDNVILTCQYCGDAYQKQKNRVIQRGYESKYCSNHCKNAAGKTQTVRNKIGKSVSATSKNKKTYNKMVQCKINENVCETCFKSFFVINKRKTCSIECAKKAISKKAIVRHCEERVLNHNKYFMKKICEYCSSEFETRTNNASKSKKYCSRKCMDNGVSIKCKGHPALVMAGLKSAAMQRETRRSKNEKLFFELCKEQFPDALANEPMFDKWDCDVVIPSIKIAVMWNGNWHYIKICKKYSLKQVQSRDKIKRKIVKKYGYYPYVIKDTGKYNPKFVQNKFDKFLKDIVSIRNLLS